MSYGYTDAAGEAVRVDCVRCAIEGMAGEATAARHPRPSSAAGQHW